MESGNVVECALTERAKKKIEKQKKSRKSEEEPHKEEEESRDPLPPVGERGVIYLGHIPHGFYENEMKSYFAQFGTVTRLKLHRSRKTGRSKGYAFIEFAYPEVAEIAAESMNNYLMFDKLLKCHVVSREKVRKGMVASNGSVNTQQKTRIQAQREHNRPRSVPEVQRRVSRLLSRERRKRKRLTELGLDYCFPGYKALCKTTPAACTPTHTIFTTTDDSEEESERYTVLEEAESE